MGDNVKLEKPKWYDVDEYKFRVEYDRYEHREDVDKYMFKDTGFKMDDDQVLIDQFSMRRHLSNEDIEVLKRNVPPQPKFKVLTKAQYERKMSCTQKKYRQKVENYYLKREEFFRSDERAWRFSQKADELNEKDKVQKAIQDKMIAEREDQDIREKDFEKRLAMLGGENDQKERKDEIEQRVSDFRERFYEVEDELKKENITVDKKAAEKLIVDRRKTRKMDNLPMLTDHEVLEKFAEIKKDDPNYYRKVCDMISYVCKTYNISERVEIRLEKYRWLLDKKQDLEKEKEIDRMIAERMEARNKKPVKFDKRLGGITQVAPQKYKNSCWARSGANLINTIMENKLENDEYHEVDDDYFIKGDEPEYNEEARKNAYKALGDVEDLGMIDNYVDTKAEIDLFRKDPDRNVGNLYLMADYFIKATDNRAMVKSAQIRIDGKSEKSIELLKDEFLKILNDALNKNAGNPVSVLNGGHYITVYGIKGRNLIYKDSLNKTNPDKEEDGLSVDTLFANNKPIKVGPKNYIGGAIEMVWLNSIDEESMKEVEEEFPDVKEDYEKYRSQPKLDILPSEYSHTKGVDFKKELSEKEDPVLTGLIIKRVYLPKGKPGEKVA